MPHRLAPEEIDAILSQPTISVWPEAGTLLGLGKQASYTAAANGTLPILRFGSRLRVPTAALRRMLDGADERTIPTREEATAPIRTVAPPHPATERPSDDHE